MVFELIPTEREEANTFMKWVRYQPKSIQDVILHLANEGKRSIVEGRNLKRMGLKKGASDYFVALPNDRYHGFWIELKRMKLSKKENDQIIFLNNMRNNGYAATFSFGADMTIKYVIKYINNTLVDEDLILT